MTLLKHPLFKQIAGGILGMGIAMGAYLAVQYTASSQISALLVGGDPRITNNAADVRVSDKKADPEFIARLASKAKQVAAQQDPSATAMEDATAARLARRKQLDQYASIAQPAVVSSIASSTVIISANEQARIAKRLQQNGLTAQDVATNQVASTQTLHSGADLSHSGNLSQTGVELPLLAFLALIATSSVYLVSMGRTLFAMEETKN